MMEKSSMDKHNYGTLSPELYAYAERLKKELKPSRFAHSLGVAALAKALAEKWGINAQKAELAGLLHDVAKNMEYAAQREYCIAHNIVVEDAPALWHAPAGAYMLRNEWGITDEDIISAVANHTVANINMTDLERIVYLADVAEASRVYEGIEEIRKLIFEDLDRAMFFNLEESLEDLARQGKYVAPASAQALEYYRKKCSESAKKGNQMMDNKQILELVIEAAKEKKAEDIISMDLHGLTVIADHFVIVSGQNNRQVQAIADNIVEKAAENGLNVAHFEGYPEGKWVLIDLGDIIIHVFQPEERKYYNLERLWGDAPVCHY